MSFWFILFVIFTILFHASTFNISLAKSLKRRSLRAFENDDALPIETIFTLPSPLLVWPQGGAFASGKIDLGGLQVSQISSFNKIWTTYDGGPDNVGASFFEPSPLPDGFFMLGSYCQTNNMPLFGRVLVGKDLYGDILKSPIDYTLVWTSESREIKQDVTGYIWLPNAPDGYKALGYVVTISSEKPSPDKIRCVRSDLTEQYQTDQWIWGNDDLDVFSLQPANRGPDSLSVSVGTFAAQIGGSKDLSVPCLKNLNFNNYSLMPNSNQIHSLFQSYSPLIYFHPDEEYLPSSVNWFFTNGALLYISGDANNPVAIDPTGSNLPQGGSKDGAYWLDLPVDDESKERVKKGDLNSAVAYLCAKPMLGGTYTDIAMWLFYPFNGPVKAKIAFISISLGKIGQHVGDWEHVTLRISNFNGELQRMYFSQHSGGTWIDASQLEFVNGNKPVIYSAKHGHAFYEKTGLILRTNDLGLRDDSDKSNIFMDTSTKYEFVAAWYLRKIEPAWLNYFREWGPHQSSDIGRELKKVKKHLPIFLRWAFKKLVGLLPKEILEEEGPTGPKDKISWNGDEI